MNGPTTSPEFNELIKTYEKFAETLREENPNMTIPKEEHQKLVVDRLAFGFDSIYFRYAEAVDELARLKPRDPVEPNTDPLWWRRWASNQKMHFYQVFEQLTGAHELEDSTKKAINEKKGNKYGT